MKRPKPLRGFHDFVSRQRPAINEVVRETTSGGIVFRHNPQSGQLEILLIQDVKNRWTIPKGHVEPGEENGATAEREIMEETGLKDIEAICWLGKVTFRYRRNDTLVLMVMHIWLTKALGNTDSLDPEEWLSDIKWFPTRDAVEKIAYEDIGKLMLVGMKKIREGNL
ncbi:MAG TPA: NUDIX domain-containing protein [Candidatus Saccharimonadales bacterium]|jgi:8-oxo-dGTP pyrophosphatase MutT (NUDIX family)